VSAEGYRGVEMLASLDSETRKFISGADTFFVANRSSVDIKLAGGPQHLAPRRSTRVRCGRR
jgi:hypothetical protein